MQHRFAPTKSWTASRFQATVIPDPAHFNLGAVVFNTKKQPTTDKDSAIHQLPTPGHFERLLDSDEAAALLGIHKKTLQRMARSGEVPGVQIGDLWRFRASTLNEWLASRLAG
jgi:excisionase family DNA binding protein